MIIGVDYKDIFDESGSVRLKKDIEIITRELELLFRIRKYSLFFSNNMGVDLEKYIELSNETATFNLIKADIEQLFLKYRRAVLKKIDMSFSSLDSTIKIDLTVAVGESGRTVFHLPLILSN